MRLAAVTFCGDVDAVDERGRVCDEAIFGSAGADFLVALIVPDARFLQSGGRKFEYARA